MRQKLKELNGERMRFRAIVARFGERGGYKGPLKTILLKQVETVSASEVITDHLWLTVGKTLGILAIGDTVEFDARVSPYEKGYKGRREGIFCETSIDYKLERPTKLRVLKADEANDPPTEE